ncbi:MAG: hypothetical protein AB8B83_01725 [Bdellovibrionales bacterium]
MVALTEINAAATTNTPVPVDFWGRSISDLIAEEMRQTNGIRRDHLIDRTFETPQYILGGQFD